jgi:MYXO-CTERM domain-containing protein
MCDDLDVAMTGISSGNLWVTRLRADLPATALAANLVLEATASQVAIPNVHNATTYTVAGYNPCAPSSGTAPASPPSSNAAPARAGGSCACRTAESSRTPPGKGGVWFALIAAAVGFGACRKRRR